MNRSKKKNIHRNVLHFVQLKTQPLFWVREKSTFLGLFSVSNFRQTIHKETLVSSKGDESLPKICWWTNSRRTSLELLQLGSRVVKMDTKQRHEFGFYKWTGKHVFSESLWVRMSYWKGAGIKAGSFLKYSNSFPLILVSALQEEGAERGDSEGLAVPALHGPKHLGITGFHPTAAQGKHCRLSGQKTSQNTGKWSWKEPRGSMCVKSQQNVGGNHSINSSVTHEDIKGY